MMTTALPARRPAPVAPLPPRSSVRTLTFSMPIDTAAIRRAQTAWRPNVQAVHPMRRAIRAGMFGGGGNEPWT